MTKGVTRPLWVVLMACGFAAVLLSNLAVGAASFRRQYLAGEASIEQPLQEAERAIAADMESQKRAAAAVALAIAGDPDSARLFAAEDRDALIARYQRNFGAERSSEVVFRAVQAMNGIEASSAKIAQITASSTRSPSRRTCWR